MTVVIKEIDGARSVEMVARDGVIYIEGRGFCYGFDRSILLHAIEREFGSSSPRALSELELVQARVLSPSVPCSNCEHLQ